MKGEWEGVNKNNYANVSLRLCIIAVTLIMTVYARVCAYVRAYVKSIFLFNNNSNTLGQQSSNLPPQHDGNSRNEILFFTVWKRTRKEREKRDYTKTTELKTDTKLFPSECFGEQL